jgi:hypothetical protein
MNCYKKRMEVILCLVQWHLNGLNDFERVWSRFRMTMGKSRVKTMFNVFFEAQGVNLFPKAKQWMGSSI